jgi:hypothetical protein
VDDLKEQTGYWKFEVLNRTLWRNRCGKGYGPVVREIIQRIDK